MIFSGLVIGELFNSLALVLLDPLQTLELESESFEHQLLFVDERAQLLFLGASRVFFALNFVAGSDCAQLGVLDFLGLRVKHLNEGRDHVVEGHNFLKKVNGLRLHVLRLLELVLGEHADLVVFIEGDIHVNFAVHLSILSD